MEKSLFSELKELGVDVELASRVSASLDPEYNASKKDVLEMQKAIMQVQMRSDARYHELNSKIEGVSYELNNKIESVSHELNNKIESVSHELNNKIESSCRALDKKIDGVSLEMHRGFAGVRTEIASMNRQFLITFGGLISTIITVFLINYYFRL